MSGADFEEHAQALRDAADLLAKALRKRSAKEAHESLGKLKTALPLALDRLESAIRFTELHVPLKECRAHYDELKAALALDQEDWATLVPRLLEPTTAAVTRLADSLDRLTAAKSPRSLCVSPRSLPLDAPSLAF